MTQLNKIRAVLYESPWSTLIARGGPTRRIIKGRNWTRDPKTIKMIVVPAPDTLNQCPYQSVFSGVMILKDVHVLADAKWPPPIADPGPALMTVKDDGEASEESVEEGPKAPKVATPGPKVGDAPSEAPTRSEGPGEPEDVGDLVDEASASKLDGRKAHEPPATKLGKTELDDDSLNELTRNDLRTLIASANAPTLPGSSVKSDLVAHAQEYITQDQFDAYLELITS